MASGNAAIALANQCIKVKTEHVFSSASERDIYHSNNPTELKLNDYCIAGDKLYQYTSDGWKDRTIVWKGVKGDTGAVPNITVGTVASGENASVSNSGTASQAVLNFILPKGNK
jgi:hypothetical protein